MIFRYSDRLLILITGLISLGAFVYFYFNGHLNLANYDAIARLNTARKLFESITPGLGQLGGVWLPMPQLLMFPFTLNSFLWRSGIAGYIVSGTAFVISAFYLQKTIFILTKKRKVALLIWFLFVSNVNVLLLQAMAMSEMVFFVFLILSCYYFLLWLQNQRIGVLLMSGFFLTALTLTRYEGFFVLGGVLLVLMIELIRLYGWRKRDRVEGTFLAFLSVAGFGIFLWCLYVLIFYKDPFYWLRAYSPPPASVILNNKALINYDFSLQNPNLWQSLGIYSSVIFWTNGWIVAAVGAFGWFWFFLKPMRQFLFIWILSAVFFVFLIAGYYVGFVPHIEYPFIPLAGDKAREWSKFADNNVRYGLLFFPFILFYISFLAQKGRLIFYIVLFFVFGQLYFSIFNPRLFQYPFYLSWKYPEKIAEAEWFRAHYDGGLVLISTARHEDFIFQSGLDYDAFIYEGTRDFWVTSLKHPSLYAKWVIYNDKIFKDGVAHGITESGLKELQTKYDLVYFKKGVYIYKMKNYFRTLYSKSAGSLI